MKRDLFHILQDRTGDEPLFYTAVILVASPKMWEIFLIAEKLYTF